MNTYGFLIGGHYVGAIYYWIVGRVGKMNRCLLALFIFPLIVVILPVKSPCTLTIISRVAPLVLVVVAGHGVCCQIFGIWDNRISMNQFWNLICGLLGCYTTRTIFRWPAGFLDMELLTTLVTGYIWPGRWPSSRATTIYTTSALEINLLQSLVDWLFNGHSRNGSGSEKGSFAKSDE